MPAVTAVIPAYNEAARIRPVIQAIQAASLVQEILVVDDGSGDDTAAVAAACGVRVIALPRNSGKGTALRTGAVESTGDILLFLDADLHGLTPEQVDALVRPVLEGQAQMTIGSFRGGRRVTDLAQYLAPHISGQRCLTRNFFLSAPLVEGSRSGVEIALTIHARANKLTQRIIPMAGTTHPLKEEKLGLWPGTLSRTRMYFDILTTLCRYYTCARHHRDAPVGNE